MRSLMILAAALVLLSGPAFAAGNNVSSTLVADEHQSAETATVTAITHMMGCTILTEECGQQFAALPWPGPSRADLTSSQILMPAYQFKPVAFIETDAPMDDDVSDGPNQVPYTDTVLIAAN